MKPSHVDPSAIYLSRHLGQGEVFSDEEYSEDS